MEAQDRLSSEPINDLESPLLSEVPSYHNVNFAYGLPKQCVALEQAVKTFGERKMMEGLGVIMSQAPFLLKSTFFINNLTFFLQNFQKTASIFQRMIDIAKKGLVTDLGSPDEVLWLLTESLKAITRNKKLNSSLPSLLSSMENFLIRIYIASSRGIRFSKEQFIDFGNMIIPGFQSNQKMDEFFNALYAGASIEEAEEKAGLIKKKYSIVGFKITDGCTVQCRYCSENAKGKRSEWNLTTVDDIKKIDWLLDQVSQVSITGGEPFDSPHLFEILEYLRKKGVMVAFLTAGGEIESLEKLLPYLKDGTIGRTDLSWHDGVGTGPRRKFQNTKAFYIRHNIPLVICVKGKNPEDRGYKTEQAWSDLADRGLNTTGQYSQEGKNLVLRFWPENPMSFGQREASVTLEPTLILPSARLDNEAVDANFLQIESAIKEAGFKPSDLCRFGNLDFRSDGTVSACDAVVGPLRSKRLMDHFPANEGELNTAIARYRENMQEIWAEADRRGCHTCRVHLERDAKTKDE